MGVPLTGVSAVVLNVTVTETLGAGYVQVFPSGPVTIGSSSSLNVEFTGQTIANQVTVPVGAGGRVSIYLQSGGHVLADVFGYYTPVESASSARHPRPHPGADRQPWRCAQLHRLRHLGRSMALLLDLPPVGRSGRSRRRR
jgi:hypothetical protein